MTFATYPSVNEITKVGGFLYWSPTNLTLESGYGTQLGYVETLVFRPNMSVIDLAAEEDGVLPSLSIYCGQAPQVIANLRNYNAAVLNRLFPSLTTDATKKFDFPGSVKTGKNLMATYASLLYMPENTTSHPAILLRLCSPHVTASANMRFSHTSPLIFPCVFAGRNYTVGLLSGITL